ncbi:phospholipase D-like domain-containing protein [Elusimicrobiota bacterium]
MNKIQVKPVVLAGFLALSVCICAGAADNSELIKIFFNQPESSSDSSKSEIANPDEGIDEALVDFIKTADDGDKLYLCFYNISKKSVINAINASSTTIGDNNVYLIHESTKSTGINDVFSELDITNVLSDETTGSPLMHNKFAVVINKKKKTGRVWTGSYNPTKEGTEDNNNNAVWIESYDMAKIYADEFNYMWDNGNGKYSTHKSTSGNTAESVNVGDDLIEVYFSPYDGTAKTDTSMVIEDLISNAAESILFNMFTFAMSEKRLKQALIDANENDVEIKGVVEASHSGSRTVQSELRAEGINVVLDANSDQMHHKFCIIDHGTSDPVVITGSYNWSDEANTLNDENFIVIHSRKAAELYWNEFQKNYDLAGGSAEAEEEQPAVSEVLIYPSPAKNSNEVTIGYKLSVGVTEVAIKIYTVFGERVISIEPDFYAGTYNEKKWNLENSGRKEVAPGLYIVKVEATTGDGTFFDTEKFVIIR